MATGKSFKLGDIVQLNAGGPEMSVKRLPSGNGTLYECQWFAGKKLEAGMFAAESLRAVETKAE